MKLGLYGIERAVVCLLGLAGSAAAIEADPTPAQIQAALDRGKQAAALHQSPDTFYTRFGERDGLHPSGFLITKLGGLAVMAAHMALRGLDPSAADVDRVVQAPTMLVSMTIFGDRPAFAVNSYVTLDQGGSVIKPYTVRADGQAMRSQAWPDSPKFQARVVAAFKYIDFDPTARTTITVFPAGGGAVSFPLHFEVIE